MENVAHCAKTHDEQTQMLGYFRQFLIFSWGLL
jgi:hypothetical protein